jgi:cytochrome c oxidase cbb3-type subunit 3
MPTKIEKDAVTGTDTTGHEWDGIKELNTPLPKWWLYVFYATIVWSIGYYVIYPSWPSLTTHLKGVTGYWSRADVITQIAEQEQVRAPFVNRIKTLPLDQIRADRDLLGFAIAGGRAAFADNCMPCHGPGGGGTKGFPNLADDDWIWGGDLANIQRTIRYGIRSAHPDSRISQMPRFGADGILTAAQINDAAEFVLSLSGGAKDAGATGRGAGVFKENCAACHGDKGEGNMEMGAPNLADGIWLYGGDKASIVRTITYSRNGSMPAWNGRLSDETIKMLSIYVNSLGGGR